MHTTFASDWTKVTCRPKTGGLRGTVFALAEQDIHRQWLAPVWTTQACTSATLSSQMIALRLKANCLVQPLSTGSKNSSKLSWTTPTASVIGMFWRSEEAGRIGYWLHAGTTLSRPP